jgi:hypothetical protein
VDAGEDGCDNDADCVLNSGPELELASRCDIHLCFEW